MAPSAGEADGAFVWASGRLRSVLERAELMCVSQGAAYPSSSLLALSSLGLPSSLRLLLGQTPDDAFLPPNVPLKTFFPSGPLGTTSALARANASYWPASLYQFASYISSRTIEPDIAVVKVTSPRDGSRSVAFHADYALPLIETSRTLILEECPRAPWLGPHLPESPPQLVGIVAGSDRGTPTAPAEPAPSPDVLRIAREVASMTPRDATVQLGMGLWTRAVAAEIGGRGIARIHTGLVDRWLIDLLDGLGGDDLVDITTSAVADDPALARHVERLHAAGRLRVEAATNTHHPATLAALRPFVAINSAWHVDLLGRANCEYLARGADVVRRGIGGLWDFASAAAAHADGVSIIALPASSRGTSRIVPLLDSAHVSLPSNLVDVVVTEFGVADLRGKSLDERVRAVVHVAAPTERPRLLSEAFRLGLDDAPPAVTEGEAVGMQGSGV